jgi:DNA repair exonuclease SbcCD ATPase subunit
MEALVVKAKELLADTENSKIGESLKSLQKEWKELGAAPREKGDELWKVFKATCDEVYERVKGERESRNAEQSENLTKKLALCERAEELQGSTDWQETGAIFKELQAEWKNIGPVPRRKSDGIWKRFRAACDAFFEARAPHLEDQHAELEENYETKRELIKEVETIAETEGDVEEQIAALRSLQRKWREIGKVAHRVYEEVNDAYKVACDKVYAKRAEQEAAAKAADIALVTKLDEEIVECADAGWDSDAEEVAKKVLDIRARHLQMDKSIEGYEELGPKIDSLIRSQLESEPDAYKGSVLDLDKSKAAYEALIAEADELAPEDKGEPDTADSESMADRLRDALADRALGGVLSRDAGVSPAERITEIRAKWLLVGPVPGAPGSALDERFAASCALALPKHTEPAPDEKED